MPCSDCVPTFTALTQLRECKIMSRLRSNQSPVAFDRDQLTEVLSDAQRELVEYDTAIARLHEMIVSLENDKRSLGRQVHLTRSLMAPIRKLPPEILRQVFIEHGVANVIRPVSSAIPGLKIASVCSYWRSIAFHTTELWNHITHGGVSIWRQKEQWHPFHVSLVKTLLELSKTSPLFITLDFCDFPGSLDRGVPPGVPLLCEHADRWHSLTGDCNRPSILEMLSCIEGRLHNLHTFRFKCPVQCCSALVKGASKLHTLATSRSMREASIPWNQIIHLQVKYSNPSHILPLLAVSPDLHTLVVGSFPGRSDDSPLNPRFRHPNLTLLDILLGNVVDAAGMECLLESVDLPNLKSFSIMSNPDEQYDQWQVAYGSHWSNQLLPSFLLCSSTITAFTLHRIWVSTNNLIVLLQRMPFLSSFLMSDPDFHDPNKSLPSMLNDDFLLNISGHSYHDRQPLLTRLTSLSLEGLVHDSFSMHAFVDVIQSRWKPSPIEDEVACIRTVKLSIRKGCIDPAVAHTLTILEKCGLDVVVKDQDGDVLARNQIPG